MELSTGNTLTLSTDDKYKESGDASVIYIDYKNITKVSTRVDTVGG